MQEFMNTMMQAMKESREQTAALREEFRKRTAKLTSTVESLKSEIREENKRVASSLTIKFEAATNKIREDFSDKLASEVATVSTKLDNIRKGNDSEISRLSSTIDEAYANLTDKVEETATSTRGYIDAELKSLAGEVQQAKRNAAEIAKIQATLEEIQNRVSTVDQPLASTSSSAGDGVTPNVTSVSAGSNVACHDSTSSISQNSDPRVCTNLNVSPEESTGSGNLNELTLPVFTDSSKQVPLHFIWDLDLYFKLKKTPDQLKLPLTFRAVQEPIAKQWFSSTYDKLTNYYEFRKGFTELLWNPNRQAGIRSQIYLDKYHQNSGESYVDHYIRYANLASSLDPPMTDMDLLSALTSHYELRVQQGLLCGNFKCTQDVLGYLSKMQGLDDYRDKVRAPRRDYPRDDANQRPQHGPRQDDRPRDRGDHVNVRHVRRSNASCNERSNNRRRQNSGEAEFYGHRQRRVEGDRSGQLNPHAQRFSPCSEVRPSNADRDNRSNSGEAQHLNN
jgi:hypothetical protein